MSIIQWSSTL